MDFHVKLNLNNIIKADGEPVEPRETRLKIGPIEVGLQFVGIEPIFVDSLSGCMRLLSVVRQQYESSFFSSKNRTASFMASEIT